MVKELFSVPNLVGRYRVWLICIRYTNLDSNALELIDALSKSIFEKYRLYEDNISKDKTTEVGGQLVSSTNAASEYNIKV